MKYVQFIVAGISYKEADEKLRGKMAFQDSKKIDLYEQLIQHNIMQSVIVSTCNRSEIYAFCEESDIVYITALFQQEAQQNLDALLYIKTKKDACQHLFEVCAGYHSMIPGEDQIESQLQDAYAFACNLHACQKQMHRMFQGCFHSVKKLKTTYQFSRFPMSIPYITIQYIKQLMSLEKKRIFVIGSGSMAELILTYLKQEPVHLIALCNRHKEKAAALMDASCMQLIEFTRRYENIDSFDIVISTTSSPHEILKAEHYPKCTHTQLLIDLAMPRDIDEAITALGHQIISIDDIAGIQLDSRNQRLALLEKAKPTLLQDVEEMMKSLDQNEVTSVISSLHQKSDECADRALALILRKVELAHHEQKIVEKILKTTFHQMVREPMQALSHAKDEQKALCAIIKTLYDLKEE